MANDRINKTIELLKERKFVSIQELVKLFSVSSETIRRDFAKLEQEKILSRVHGGAISLLPNYSEHSYDQRKTEHVTEKQAIGRIAAELVMDDDTIIVSGGTTTLEFVKQLKDKKRITMITNARILADEMMKNENVTVIQLGGIIDRIGNVTSGIMVKHCMSMIHAKKAFISSAGVSIYAETISHFREAPSQDMRQMIEAADETILIVDHSKFFSSALWKICDLTKINFVVTDSKVDLKVLQYFRNKKIKVLVANTNIDEITKE